MLLLQKQRFPGFLSPSSSSAEGGKGQTMCQGHRRAEESFSEAPEEGCPTGNRRCGRGSAALPVADVPMNPLASGQLLPSLHSAPESWRQPVSREGLLHPYHPQALPLSVYLHHRPRTSSRELFSTHPPGAWKQPLQGVWITTLVFLCSAVTASSIGVFWTDVFS